MARPTTLTDEVIALAKSYVENFADHGHAVPSVVGLCRVIDRARSTVYAWAEDGEGEFSDILESIIENQELVTFNKSLTGDYNATIAKLLLGKHGYSDKQEINAEVTQHYVVSDTPELTAEEWNKKNQS